MAMMSILVNMQARRCVLVSTRKRRCQMHGLVCQPAARSGYVCMDVWMYVCIYVRRFVCVHNNLYLHACMHAMFVYPRSTVAHSHTIPVRVKATVCEGHGKPPQQDISVSSTTVQNLHVRTPCRIPCRLKP